MTGPLSKNNEAVIDGIIALQIKTDKLFILGLSG